MLQCILYASGQKYFRMYGALQIQNYYYYYTRGTVYHSVSLSLTLSVDDDAAVSIGRRQRLQETLYVHEGGGETG